MASRVFVRSNTRFELSHGTKQFKPVQQVVVSKAGEEAERPGMVDRRVRQSVFKMRRPRDACIS